MKILMIYDLAPPVKGGVENYITNLSKGLIAKGNEVHWLTSRLPNTRSEETFEGIRIHRVNIPFSKNYLFPGRQLFPFVSLFKGIRLARKMDVIHVNTLTSGLLGWVIGRLAKKPSLLFCHEFYGKLWYQIGRNPLEKYIYPLFEKFISSSPYNHFACPSEYSKKTLIINRVSKNKITVIPHGIIYKEVKDVKLYRKKYNLENTPTFGYLGRLNIKGTGQAKNISTLLESVKLVTKEFPDAKFVLGGDGYDELLYHIKKLGISDKIIYLGKIPQNDTLNFLTACDAIVCPALSDGFCFLLAEASACGIPVIGTNLGAHLERIQHNKNGLLVDPNPESIANGIIKILKNKQFAMQLGENGKLFGRELDWEKSAKKHLEIYRRIQKQN